MKKIVSIKAREIIDSRANPTVECELTLSDGTSATAQVPSGASTGAHEAYELRDGDGRRYRTRGVLHAVKNVEEVIAPALHGMDIENIYDIDSVMISLDGTHNKSNLGANAILSVSIAAAKAGARSYGMPLYRYLGGIFPIEMPLAMMNILNGGVHADNNIDIQEFMIIPTGAESFSEGVRMSCEVYHTLKNILASEGYSTSVGDEGGFAPDLEGDEEAIKMILRAIDTAGFKAGRDFMLALDVASSEWKTDDGYRMPKREKNFTSFALCDYLLDLTEKYPILSIEDGAGEDDTLGWKRLGEMFRNRDTMLVGDDLFVTNTERIKSGIKEGIGNSVLIKPNQIGSISETVTAVMTAKNAGYKTVMSHRSGDTEDSFIADLAVALGCPFIKTGAPARAERTAKYNRLMKIESELSHSRCGILK